MHIRTSANANSVTLELEEDEVLRKPILELIIHRLIVESSPWNVDVRIPAPATENEKSILKALGFNLAGTESFGREIMLIYRKPISHENLEPVASASDRLDVDHMFERRGWTHLQ